MKTETVSTCASTASRMRGGRMQERRPARSRSNMAQSPMGGRREEVADLLGVVAGEELVHERDGLLEHRRDALGRKLGEAVGEDLLLALEERRHRALVDAEEARVEAEVAREAGAADAPRRARTPTRRRRRRGACREDPPLDLEDAGLHEVVEIARARGPAGRGARARRRAGASSRGRARSDVERRCFTSRSSPRCSGVNASSCPSSTARMACSGMNRSFWSC